MSEGKEPYSIDPDPADGAPAPLPPVRPLADVPAPVQPKGKIEAPKLLDGFEEDADFDKDPELDRVVLGKPVTLAEPPAKPALEDFVLPGLGNAKVWAVVGVVLLVAAMIATGMQTAPSAQQRLLRVLLVLYNTLLHTGTGVVAVFIAATLLTKRLGPFELAASRMFAAVGAFALVMSLRLSLFGIQWLDNVVVLILASGGYVLLVASTFNLWKKHPLAYVIGSHFFLWLIVAIGMLLSQAIVPMTTPKPRPVENKTP
jgi:hypothetical protein